jgi:hypothetical protein
MHVLKLAAVGILAATLLSGCCGLGSANKTYPYPIYDYSPAKVCGFPTTPVPAPCTKCGVPECKSCN